jgi:excisionase family DNA binding protein
VDEERWLLRHEVARYLGITPDGVVALEKRGKIRSVRTDSGRYRLYPWSEVERVLRERQQTPRGRR